MTLVNDKLASLFPAHIAQLQKTARTALTRENLEGLVIHSGQELKAFLDDNSYPFRVNPHFKYWLPLTEVTNSWLVINGEDKPTLIYYQPVDFWHKVTPLPESYWNEFFDIKVLSKATEVDQLLPYDKKGYAYIGEHLEVARALGFENINPEPLVNYFHYHRAYKTPYEQECLRQSNRLAVLGHLAAKKAFLNGDTEFDIQNAYLKAVGCTTNDTPYGNIVALNRNCSILHYTALDKVAPQNHQSFLIDAGAQFNGYASDITRTYSFRRDKFAELITRMDQLMLKAVDGLKPGLSYVDLHINTHREIAKVLREFNLITVDADTAVASGVVSSFFPHGLGHHLGLQTHDVGGFMADERGTHVNAPQEHPFLRTSRVIETGQVFTIEPGLYFIDSLLADLKVSSNSDQVNWQNIEELRPFGGIRIEDNIIVHQSHNENMTRDLGLS
ncbi:Xaa-Pro dipeptidase [Litorilituus sediminis]|uniref:Xaa-Pro dipeptidase n=1 Tax=Litorilituus sediminis TaxID=718192 RepID=A0A4P6P9R5_9GAMM|nr:Xaa-Pro dipeptidase [Litorilituus sediminis]QBG36287.1 Xaa-Pro dipeptidase [Litorilituus sediminis]